jgi:hypothetical protein
VETPDVALEKHYTISQIAESWNMDYKTVRRLFEHEPGVLTFGEGGTLKKRKYISLRVPDSVVRRVHREYRTS